MTLDDRITEATAALEEALANPLTREVTLQALKDLMPTCWAVIYELVHAEDAEVAKNAAKLILENTNWDGAAKN